MSRAEKRRSQTDAALIALRTLFPAAFPTDPAAVRPLAIGTWGALAGAGIASRTTLHRALWRWCRQPEYLAAIAEGRPRINLDGTDAGPVAPEHQAQAAERLAKLAAKAERRTAASVPAPVPEPEPTPAPPARPVLTLKRKPT